MAEAPRAIAMTRGAMRHLPIGAARRLRTNALGLAMRCDDSTHALVRLSLVMHLSGAPTWCPGLRGRLMALTRAT
jgi:hypothetical protein